MTELKLSSSKESKLQEFNRINDKSSAIGDMDQMPIEMTNATGTYIQDLNEYCLLDIFSSNSLTLVDLYSLAETCKLFKRIIQPLLPKKFGISITTQRRYIIKWNKKSEFHRERDVERIFNDFGTKPFQISIHEYDDVMNLIANCRRDGTKSTQNLGLPRKSIFQQLQRLSVHQCTPKDCLTPVVDCDSLIELNIVLTGCVAILENTFPSLEEFTFRYKGNQFFQCVDNHTDAILKFIGRHRRLRVLKLCGKSVWYSSDFLNAIGSYCEQLEELSLLGLRKTMTDLNDVNPLCLPKLRKLIIVIGFEDCSHITALLQASMSLDTVKLPYVKVPVPVHVYVILSEMQNLRDLRMVLSSLSHVPWTMLTRVRKLSLLEMGGTFYLNDLLELIRQLPNLDELVIESSFLFDCAFCLSENSFAQIVETVKCRLKVLTLSCQCNFDTLENYNENRNVRLIQLTDLY